MSKKGEPRDKLSKAQREEVITGYLSGQSYRLLSDKFKVSDSAIWSIITHAKIPRGRRQLSSESISNAAAFCSAQRVPTQMQPHTFSSRRQRKTLNLSAFTALTPDSAYWLGLIASDGSILIRDGGAKVLVLQLTEPDGYQVSAFRDFLCSNHKITEVPAGVTSQGLKRRTCYRLSIVSTDLAKTIEFYGIDRHKTYNIKLKHVNKHPDFWRGVIDGDGHVRFPRTGSLELIGSPNLISYFKDFCYALYPSAHLRIAHRQHSDLCILTGKTAGIVLRALYHTAGPALRRKQLIAERIYNIYYQGPIL